MRKKVVEVNQHRNICVSEFALIVVVVVAAVVIASLPVCLWFWLSLYVRCEKVGVALTKAPLRQATTYGERNCN